LGGNGPASPGRFHVQARFAPPPAYTVAGVGYVRERVSALAIAAALALAAIGGGLAGCGDDDEDGGGSDGDVATQDADAKAAARNAQVALEVYVTENTSYSGATPETLEQIEPSIADAELTVTAEGQTYELTVDSESGNSFTLSRDEAGMVSRSCEAEGEGGCPDGGEW
jgi:hypothetical protein